MKNLHDGEQRLEPQKDAQKPQTLKLVELKSFNLPGGLNVREATDTEFLMFASSVVGLGGTWGVEARRDFINWALREGLVEADLGENKPNLIRIKNSDKNSGVQAQNKTTDVL